MIYVLFDYLLSAPSRVFAQLDKLHLWRLASQRGNPSVKPNSLRNYRHRCYPQALEHVLSDAEPLEQCKMHVMAKKKNPAAVSLGRLGGKKSVEGRMKKLTPQQRSEIAKHAARARWRKRNPEYGLHVLAPSVGAGEGRVSRIRNRVFSACVDLIDHNTPYHSPTLYRQSKWASPHRFRRIWPSASRLCNIRQFGTVARFECANWVLPSSCLICRRKGVTR